MLSEWHISPDEILERWTDERMAMFWEKRNDRIVRESEAMKRAMERDPDEKPPVRVSHNAFFNRELVGPAGTHFQNPNAGRFKRIPAAPATVQ